MSDSGSKKVWDFRQDSRCSERKAPAEELLLSKPVFLVGFMGSGKTTTARKLARIAGVGSIDIDSFIARQCDCGIADIFAAAGEEGFRRIETGALREVSQMGPLVVSCGGGVVESEENRRILRESGYVVHLKISALDAYRRIRNFKARPLFGDLENAERICARRCPLYDEVADFTVEVAGRTTASVAYELKKHLRKKGVLWQRG